MKKQDLNIHIRLMGSPAVGKSTLVSTIISRSAQKRQLPYQRSKHSTRYFCPIKQLDGKSIATLELIDTKGNETLEGLVNNVGGDERKSLLARDGDGTYWCYILLFDYTRQETYLHVKNLIDKIRLLEATLAHHDRYNNSRRNPPSIIVLIGNKREQCVSSTISSWIRDQSKFCKEKAVFLFSGSAIDNDFVSLERIGTERGDFVLSTLQLHNTATTSSSSTSDFLDFEHVTIDHVLYLIKMRSDYEFRRGEYSLKKGVEAIFDNEMDVKKKLLENDDDDDEDDDDKRKNSSNFCRRCCRRCC